MIDKGAATEDEVVLEFLRGDMNSPEWAKNYSVSRYWTDREALIHEDASHTDCAANRARRELLREGRAGLLRRFPACVDWRRCELSLEELKTARYLARCEKWARVSRLTREVGVGARYVCMDRPTATKVDAIARRYRKGETLPPLIAVRAHESDPLVMLEGHHRATALALVEPPNIEVLVGTTPRMRTWPFY